MKTKQFLGMIGIVALVFMVIPAVLLTQAATTDTFTVSATVSNAAPTIGAITTQGDTPNEGATKSITIYFNATDTNGNDTLDISTAYVNLTNGGTTKQSSSCTATGTSATTSLVACTMTLNYYDANAAWTINAYIEDEANAAVNRTGTFNVGLVDSVDVVQTSISFGTVTPGQSDVGATENPVTVNNTGNQAYTGISVTAQDLSGGAAGLAASQFAVNTVANPAGQALTDNSPVSVTGATLSVGASATRSLYFYLDVPATIDNAAYTANGGNSWLIDPTTA